MDMTLLKYFMIQNQNMQVNQERKIINIFY